jgi:FMN reductase
VNAAHPERLRLADTARGSVERRVVVITAGLSEPSSTRLLADLLAEATRRAFEGAGTTVEVDLVELRPLAHAVTDAMLTGFAAGELADAVRKVATADGVVAVTPVFGAAYSGLFKSFVDILERGSLEGTPVVLAATAGTARHSLVLEHAMRPLFSHLRALVAPTAVFAASEDWGPAGADGALRRRVDRATEELADLVLRRPAAPALDRFDRDVAAMGDFENLLRGT